MPQEPSSKRLISATQMSPVTESQLASGSDGDRIVDHKMLRVLPLLPIRRDEGLAPVLLRRRPRGRDRQGAQEAHEGARRHGPDQARRAVTGRDPDPQGAGPEHGRQAERDPHAPCAPYR